MKTTIAALTVLLLPAVALASSEHPSRSVAIKTERGIWKAHYGAGNFKAGSIKYSTKTGAFSALWREKSGRTIHVSDTVGGLEMQPIIP
jgi:hypothetical protein